MELIVISILVVWVAVSAVLARSLARNGLSPMANATILALGGYAVVVVGTALLLQKTMMPYARLDLVITPIAIAGAVAAVLVWLLSLLVVNRVRKAA